MIERKIAVLIPCYNEEMTIAQVIQDFRQQIPTAEIVVADNASTDKTGEVARKHGARVVEVSRRGKGAAVRHLFRTVEADFYVMTDGDATYPAAAVHDLLRPVQEGLADMTVGDRHTSGSYKEQNKRPFHQFGNRLVTYLINTLFRSQLKDIMSGYRAFNREFVKNAPVLSDGFQVETEMTLHALDKMFNIVEIPIAYKDRPPGSHSKLSTVKDGIRVLRTIVWVFKDCKPLVFFTSVAGFFVSLSVIMGIFFYYYKSRYEGSVPPFGWLIGSASSFLIAVGSLACGFILDTIVKMDRARFEVNLIQFFERRARRESLMSAVDELGVGGEKKSKGRSGSNWVTLLALIIMPVWVNFLGIYSFAGDGKGEDRPRYCQADAFWSTSANGFNFEESPGIKRMMRFRLGGRQLIGLAVGQSDAYATAKVALDSTQSGLDGNYCTWYFNQGNASASTLFHWVYLPKPSSNTWLNPEVRNLGWEEIQRVYGSEFFEELPAMVRCLIHHRYLAMGCNGMRERGPTVFGMLLAFAGCTPQEVSQIVNPVWGRGWPVAIVSEKDREEVLLMAYLLGTNGVHSEHRQVLQQLLASEI